MKKIWILLILLLVGCSSQEDVLPSELEVDIQTMERQAEAEAPALVVEENKPWIRVYVDLLNVRAQAVTGEVLGKLKEGFLFEALSTETVDGKIWYKLDYNGVEAYVAGWLCQTVYKKDSVLDGVPMVHLPDPNQTLYMDHMKSAETEAVVFESDYSRIFETYYDDQSTIWYKVMHQGEDFKWLIGTTYDVHIMDPLE